MNKWRDKLLTFAKAAIVYAFTGTLSEIEVQCIKSAFNADIIVYPKNNSLKVYQNTQLKYKETDNKDDWITALAFDILEKCKSVPVLVLTTGN